MKTRWILAIALVLLLALTLSGCQSRLEGVARQANRLINENDFANVLPLYSDDVQLISSPFCPADHPCKGKIPVVMAYRMQVEGGMIARIVDLKVSGSVVKSRMEVRGDINKAAGVDRFIMNSTLTFTGDKISNIVEEYDTSDPQTAIFVAWMKTKHP